ncbi:MAG: hypothetical protein ACSHX0_00365 [Akkermansiaceae bacterium]
MIKFNCPECGILLEVDESYEKISAPCPSCDHVISAQDRQLEGKKLIKQVHELEELAAIVKQGALLSQNNKRTKVAWVMVITITASLCAFFITEIIREKQAEQVTPNTIVPQEKSLVDEPLAPAQLEEPVKIVLPATPFEHLSDENSEFKEEMVEDGEEIETIIAEDKLSPESIRVENLSVEGEFPELEIPE